MLYRLVEVITRALTSRCNIGELCFCYFPLFLHYLVIIGFKPELVFPDTVFKIDYICFFILLLFIPAEFFVSEKQLNTGGASPLTYNFDGSP